jgi:hypothetical protein
MAAQAILLEHSYPLGEFETRIEAFVDHYNHGRHNERLNNLTPADVYSRRG